MKVEYKRYMRQNLHAEKQFKHDSKQVQMISERRSKYLENAVKHYIQSLFRGSYGDFAVYRLISLWFENPDDKKVRDMMMSAVCPEFHQKNQTIPSYRFIPLVYQIASRVKSDNSDFHRNVNFLMKRMAIEHPHHCLYQICSLKYGKKKNPVADQILSEMKKSSETAQVVNTTEELIRGYIQLAEHKVPKSTRQFKISSYKLSRIKNLSLLPVPTQKLPIKRDNNYSSDWNAVMMSEFDSTVKMAESGIHRPKILNVRGNDGKLHKQLLKPDDDLRQDAVMEQLFMLVDGLLKKSSDARQRKLNMRTYIIVPITEKVGVLEWVLNTLPIGIWQDKAHKRYNPKDMDPSKARTTMYNANRKSLKQKHETYMSICKKFHPVMHKFFLETFSDSCAWFASRLRYARSLAVICVVGYVVGLGDRHTQNILIDLVTAELIHIDLGIAFDQGKLLKTPEIVPFRLTRDLVDALGVQGVNGTFHRAAVCTMELLREYSQMMMTVLEVFIHDPLYKWHLSEAQIDKLQAEAEEKQNDFPEADNKEAGKEEVFGQREAQRALFLLKQKFQGIEQGEQLSVEGQVSKLVQEAMDPINLCQMYCGWQAWV